MDNYNKLLKSYLGLTGVLLGTQQAGAQVIYHDFVPDTLFAAPNTCAPVYFDLDLDSNAVVDYRFSAEKCIPSPATTYGCRSENLRILQIPTNTNKLVPAYYSCVANNSTYTNVGQAKQMIPGSTIGPAINFMAYSLLRDWDYCTFQSWLTDCGTWDAGTTASIGLRFKINGFDHYGWVRITAMSKSSLKILDYAYQSQPGIGVRAGSLDDLSTSIPDISNQVTFSIADNMVTVNSAIPFINTTIKVTDLLGRLISEETINGNSHNIQLPGNGIYVFHLEGKQVNMKRKLFAH